MANDYVKKSWSGLLPSGNLDSVPENIEEFFRIMFERQEIWHKRFILKLPRPWSNDGFLRDYKFTNVYRELDRCSQYSIHNIMRNEDLMRRDLIFQIMLFRIFNKPETFDHIYPEGLPYWRGFDEKDFMKRIMKFTREVDKNPFTTAYLINAAQWPGQIRHEAYCKYVIPKIHEIVEPLNKLMLTAKSGRHPNDAYEIAELLQTLPAVAGFISQEFYVDFCYTARYSKHRLMPSLNENSYTYPGPGAKVGLRLTYPSTPTRNYLKRAMELRDMGPDMLAKFGDFKYLNWDKEKAEYYVTPGKGVLNLHQIEMWLCEYQKYWKMRMGEGKQRSQFVPITDAKRVEQGKLF